MLRSRSFVFTILSISSLLFSSCQYDKLLKSDDFDAKYEKAKDYYSAGDYARALPLLDQLLSVKLGTPQEKEVRYYMAYCYYGQEDYFSSSSLFRQVFNIFPLSAEAEECLFMYAKSLYMASPRYQLEQSYTYKAIDAFQYFIDVYPKSALVKDANGYMDELRSKLEEKLITAAELYYNTEHFEAAAITYANVLLDFPDTRDAEDISFRILSSYFSYAGQSILCRKPERYDLAIESYRDYIARYPTGDKVEMATSLYERSVDLKSKAINEINTYKINCNELTQEN